MLARTTSKVRNVSNNFFPLPSSTQHSQDHQVSLFTSLEEDAEPTNPFSPFIYENDLISGSLNPIFPSHLFTQDNNTTIPNTSSSAGSMSPAEAPNFNFMLPEKPIIAELLPSENSDYESTFSTPYSTSAPSTPSYTPHSHYSSAPNTPYSTSAPSTPSYTPHSHYSSAPNTPYSTSDNNFNYSTSTEANQPKKLPESFVSKINIDLNHFPPNLAQLIHEDSENLFYLTLNIIPKNIKENMSKKRKENIQLTEIKLTKKNKSQENNDIAKNSSLLPPNSNQIENNTLKSKSNINNEKHHVLLELVKAINQGIEKHGYNSPQDQINYHFFTTIFSYPYSPYQNLETLLSLEKGFLHLIIELKKLGFNIHDIPNLLKRSNASIESTVTNFIGNLDKLTKIIQKRVFTPSNLYQILKGSGKNISEIISKFSDNMQILEQIIERKFFNADELTNILIGSGIYLDQVISSLSKNMLTLEGLVYQKKLTLIEIKRKLNNAGINIHGQLISILGSLYSK